MLTTLFSNSSTHAVHNVSACQQAYHAVLNLMNKHVKIPTAPNCIYSMEMLHKCLIYLSMNQHYAESGLGYLHLHAPSADAFLYRLKKLDYEQAYSMMIEANNALIGTIAAKGILKKRAIVAIDYTKIPYYGKYNSMVYRSQHKDGTSMFYCYATISIVEHGRRICLYALPVRQLDQKHEILVRLIEYARKIVRIRLLLVDRAFFTIDCINARDYSRKLCKYYPAHLHISITLHHLAQTSLSLSVSIHTPLLLSMVLVPSSMNRSYSLSAQSNLLQAIV
ncbi:MAG: hypothetical protein QW769_05695 [Nitrososphaerales archaeon]